MGLGAHLLQPPLLACAPPVSRQHLAAAQQPHQLQLRPGNRHRDRAARQRHGGRPTLPGPSELGFRFGCAPSAHSASMVPPLPIGDELRAQLCPFFFRRGCLRRAAAGERPGRFGGWRRIRRHPLRGTPTGGKAGVVVCLGERSAGSDRRPARFSRLEGRRTGAGCLARAVRPSHRPQCGRWGWRTLRDQQGWMRGNRSYHAHAQLPRPAGLWLGAACGLPLFPYPECACASTAGGTPSIGGTIRSFVGQASGF